ncbi:hypothetical protein [Streptomyces triticirhizae]|uniref:Uncharacterized protein n=1 Tax=Streptomyces triticirhizae TaxID=2483353 RepID=A0A3M2LSG5_9ACTN|nr:hypothetical protein [Streptomyces triticirhizae]RMI39035.1 hypothetical protein EBN88_15720 [Streptomyces triticirhizae]
MTGNGGWRLVCGTAAAVLLVALGALVREAEARPVPAMPDGDRAGQRGSQEQPVVSRYSPSLTVIRLGSPGSPLAMTASNAPLECVRFGRLGGTGGRGPVGLCGPLQTVGAGCCSGWVTVSPSG